jgi:hypothetical protein
MPPIERKPWAHTRSAPAHRAPTSFLALRAAHVMPHSDGQPPLRIVLIDKNPDHMEVTIGSTSADMSAPATLPKAGHFVACVAAAWSSVQTASVWPEL